MLEAHTIGYFITEVRIVMGTVYTVLVAVSISRNGDGQAALRPIRYRDWMQPQNRSKVQGCHARHGQRNREVDLMPLRVIESVRSISLHHQRLGNCISYLELVLSTHNPKSCFKRSRPNLLSLPHNKADHQRRSAACMEMEIEMEMGMEKPGSSWDA